MTRYSVRAAGVVAIFALGTASFVALPAAAAPLKVGAAMTETPPAVTPDEATSDESTQDYDVEKRGSKVDVTNTEDAPSSLEVAGTIIQVAQEVEGDATTFLLLESGVAVPLDIDLPKGVASGSQFTGTLSLTEEVTDDLDVAVTQTSPIDTDSALGELVTDAAVDTETELPIEEGTFSPAPMTSALGGGSSREINVAVVVPSSGTSSPIPSTSYLTTMVQTAESYWVRESKGVISEFTIPAAISGGYPLFTSSYNCDSATKAVNMWTSAWSRYKSTVYSTAESIYSFVIVVPKGSCQNRAGFIGLGNVGYGFGTTGQANPGPQAYSSVLIDARSTAEEAGGVLIHELGHNFGLGHSDWFACTSSSYIDYKYTSGNSCKTFDYYDFYDPMGFEVDDPGVLSAPNKIKLGILANGGVDGYVAVPSLPSGTSSSTSTVTIAPISDTTGVRAIRVKDPIYGKYYYVEYRSGTGDDAGAYYKTVGKLKLSNASDQWSHGVGVRVLKNYGGGGYGDDTLELSSIPAGASPNSRDLAMDALDGFTSYGGGIQVDVVSIDPGVEAEIQITLRHSDVMVPKLSGPQLSGTVAVGSPLTFVGLKNWQIPGSTQSYKWTRNGYSICGQSSSATSYTPRAFEAGSTIEVTTTAKKKYVTTGVSTATATLPGGGETSIPRPTVSYSSSPRQQLGGTARTATVTIDGDLDGTLSVIDCNTSVQDGIPLTAGSPTTTFTLPNTIDVGYRSLSIAFVPNPGSDTVGSVSARKTIRVYKGYVKPVISPSAVTGTKGAPITLHVAMPLTGDKYPGGKVSLYLNGTKKSTKTLSSTGETDFTYNPGGPGTKKFVVKFAGSGRFSASTSLTTYIVIS
jgi:hypothetical protein